jgi:hypothetical protein
VQAVGRDPEIALILDDGRIVRGRHDDGQQRPAVWQSTTLGVRLQPG